MHKNVNAEGLKPGWKVWRFEQMATNVNVRIDNPSESGMEHYVGLEHLDPDSLRIRRWGSPSDVEAGKLLFKTGDIIFAKRRAYQRKLGVAQFDGICSAHAMVLRAQREVVLPEFLPYFMQSDLFMNRAVEISVGSLSPTINWKTMALQEFTLPNMDEQKIRVELLSAIEELINELDNAYNALLKAQQSFLIQYFSIEESNVSNRANRPKIVRVGSVAESIVPGRTKPKQFDGDLPWLVTADLNCPILKVAANALRVSDEELKRVGGKIVPAGSVVITCVGNLGVVSLVEIPCSLNQQLHAFISKPGVIDPSYLAVALRAQKRQMESLANTTTVPYLNKENCESIRIPLPDDLNVQRQFAAEMLQFDSGLDELIARLSDLKSMKRRVLTMSTA